MIKTKAIQTPKGRLLVVGGLPEPEAYSYDIHNEEGMPTSVLVWVDDLHCYPLIIDDLPLGSNYELLGKLPDITEEQAKEVVLDLWIGGFGERYFHQNSKNSLGNYVHFKTAKESLLSLVESEVPLRNKYGERRSMVSHPYMTLEEIHEEQDNWESEQKNIFTNPVLFWEPQSKKP